MSAPDADLWLVRHGQADAGWERADPPLSELGRQQARECAQALAGRLAEVGRGAGTLLCSPLRRTRETAGLLGDRLGLQPRVEPRLVEFPSPGMELEERSAWLRRCMGMTWDELAEHEFLLQWREDIRRLLLELRGTVVLSTHFMVINAALGWARGDGRTLIFHPANCSVTGLRRQGEELEVVGVGEQTEDIRRVL